MRLYVISRYRSGDRDYMPGLALDLRDEEVDFLLRDSPGSFSLDPPASTKKTATDVESHTRPAPRGNVR